MAILHLQLDIDSEVLPELHAALSRIASATGRAERLRQLGTAGLIWEHLRLQAAAGAAASAPLPTLPAGYLRPNDAVPADPAPQRGLSGSTAPASAAGSSTLRGTAAAAEAPPARPRDLATPADMARRRPPAGLRNDLKPNVVLPVLQDVVVDAPSAAAPPLPAIASAPVVPSWMGTAASVPDVAGTPMHATEGTGESAEHGGEPRAEASPPGGAPLDQPGADVPHGPPGEPGADAAGAIAANATDDLSGVVQPLPRKAATRSRLARMQERGLFKNG